MIRILLSIFTLIYSYILTAQSTEDLFKKAEFAYCDNNIPLAIKHLKNYKSLPKYKLYHIYINTKLGDLYLEQKDTNQAITFYTQALDNKLVRSYARNRFSCSFFQNRPRRMYSNICVKLSKIYKHKKEYDKAKRYLKLTESQYKPNSYCGNDMIDHRISIKIEEAKIDLQKGDTIKARNSMLDFLFHNYHFNEIKTILYTSVKDTYTKKELQKELIKGIKEGYIDKEGKYYIMTFFNHTVKKNKRSSESKERIITQILEMKRIKEILN